MYCLFSDVPHLAERRALSSEPKVSHSWHAPTLAHPQSLSSEPKASHSWHAPTSAHPQSLELKKFA
jgi:hypothetical protein